jgi:hypothetical protein
VAESERGAVTPSPVISRKVLSCAALAGWPGSSAQARWLMTSVMGPASAAARVAAQSAGSIPSRFMPLSS